MTLPASNKHYQAIKKTPDQHKEIKTNFVIERVMKNNLTFEMDMSLTLKKIYLGL